MSAGQTGDIADIMHQKGTRLDLIFARLPIQRQINPHNGFL